MFYMELGKLSVNSVAKLKMLKGSEDLYFGYNYVLEATVYQHCYYFSQLPNFKVKRSQRSAVA